MFRDLRISTKIITILLAVAVTAVGITALLSYQTSKKTLEQESFNKLTAVRELKADQIEDYFQIIRDQVEYLFDGEF